MEGEVSCETWRRGCSIRLVGDGETSTTKGLRDGGYVGLGAENENKRQNWEVKGEICDIVMYVIYNKICEFD